MKKALPVLICLLAVTAAVSMATGCSPPTFNPIDSLTMISIGAKGNFQVELVAGYPDNDYTGNNQTWCYNVTVLADKGDLSHWCLNLCDEPEHQILSWSGPTERIEYTNPTWNEGAYGHIIKWDGTTLGPGESAIFCFTLDGIWKSGQIEWFAKNGALWGLEEPKFADTGSITGPGCLPLCVLPTADFVVDKNNVCAGAEIIFADISTPNDITAWNWFFPEGDPSSANTQGPHVIIYNSPGNYTVSLNVSNNCGSHTETKTGYITVEDCFPVPQIYNLTISSTAGGSATVTINSTAVIGPGETKTISEIPINTVVNLTASAHASYEFVNWTGDPIDGVIDAVTAITMQDNYEITANFKALPAPVTPPNGIVVGWETFPVNKLIVLSPWIALFAAFMAGTVLLVLKRHKT